MSTTDSDPPEWDEDEPTGVIVRRLSREIRTHAKSDDTRWAEISTHMKASSSRDAFLRGALAVLAAIGSLILGGVAWLISTTAATATEASRVRDLSERNGADIARLDDRVRAIETTKRGDDGS